MIEFYNVRKKTKVEIDKSQVTGVVYERKTKAGKQIKRYGLKAVDDDGTKLTKFCSEEVYNSL